MKFKSKCPQYLVAIVATFSLGLSGCNFSMMSGYVFDYSGETAEYSEEGTFDSGVNLVDVVNQFGDVNVSLAEGEAGWKWESKVWADTQEQADLLIDELILNVQTNGATQTFEVLLPEQSSELNGVKSILTLMVPADVKAKLENRHGNVDVRNLMTDVDVTNAHGNIELADLEGGLVVLSSHGDLAANRISDGSMELRHGDGDIRDVTGSLSVDSAHGRVNVEKVSGELKYEGSHSHLDVEQVDQDAQLVSSHGNIVAANLVGNVTAENRHGSTKISTSGETVSIDTAHGNVELSMTSHEFHLVDVKAAHGSIKVKLPDNCSPLLEMEANHGKASSDFESSGSSQQRVKLETSHGNIRVTQAGTVVGSVQQQ